MEFAKDTDLRSSEVMVSFDIKSLFTKVPVEEALQVIQQKLEKEKEKGEEHAGSGSKRGRRRRNKD